MNPSSTPPLEPAASSSADARWVPLMLAASSAIMALAWLGHIRFREELALVAATFLAWLLVLPEYGLNIAALRRGYGKYSGGEMAAFRLCSGVVWIALVSRFVLEEALTPYKLIGFVLMCVAMWLITSARSIPETPGANDQG
jgi:uncharacterized protein (DUF486 family)